MSVVDASTIASIGLAAELAGPERLISERRRPERPAARRGDPPPGPTLIPFAMAIGITLVVIGTTIDWLFSAVGGVIFVVTLVMWIRDTRRDVSELPEEHHS